MNKLNIQYGLINISQKVNTNNSDHIIGLIIVAVGIGIIASSKNITNSNRKLLNGKI